MESRTIKLTPAAHAYGNLNLTACGPDFFPKDVYGPSSAKQGLGKPITLRVDGLDQPIKTDIPIDKNTKKPRRFFRQRIWLKEFLDVHKLTPNDSVIIKKLDRRIFSLSPTKKSIMPKAPKCNSMRISKSKHPNKSLLTYISLFSGAGVGCYGFYKENFQCVATNEILEKRLKIQKYNKICKYDSGYIHGDLSQKPIKQKVYEQIEFYKKNERINDIDVIIATPPCQGMSVANHKKKNELKRNSLVTESIILVKDINPKFFVFENVRSFLTTSCTDIDGQLKPIKTAIKTNLGNYNILFTTMNCINYGNPSQRTRTIVIGVRKDLRDVTPYDILPNTQSPLTLRQSIGHLKSFTQIGQIDPSDIYHNFRPYPAHMLDWIKDLKEGQSAFENHDISKKPHRCINGKIVINKNKNGDKYKRCYWDKPGFCIHTRNDQLASQMTIHPSDSRVFSIRELMILMSIPSDFRWTDISFDKLNSIPLDEKRKFLRKEEMNIRQVIGEAVPTIIFNKIAHKIKYVLQNNRLNDTDIHQIIQKNNLHIYDNLTQFIESHLAEFSFNELSKIAELANSKRLHNAAYYTSQDICYSIIKDLPPLKKSTVVKILEPSVGIGNFLPLLFEKYREKEKIIIDVLDIDTDSIKLLKLLLRKLKIPENVQLNFINDDFLFPYVCWCGQYDIVIGNPPYKKVTGNKGLLALYKKDKFNTKTNNIFVFFLEKALMVGNHIAFILPKALLSAPEYNKTRQLLEKHHVLKICDYGEMAFNIKIETISIIVKTIPQKNKKQLTPQVKIESYIENNLSFLSQDYIFDDCYPCWLIYRNNFFDKVASRMLFNIFTVFRDRQITNKLLSDHGKYRVLKSRNIADNHVINIKGYDCYIDDLNGLGVARYLNKNKIVMIPNLTYNPRACYLPKNCITDGSVALATPSNGRKITKNDLAYYATVEFNQFYRIARNRCTRSMNIDSNSIFFFGIKQ